MTENDLSGRRFGRLRALHRSPRTNLKHGTWWRCICTCGKTCDVRTDNLTTGAVQSCGCLRVKAEVTKAVVVKTALSKTLSKAGSRTKRVGDAFAQVFRAPPDTVHVDRKGARVVRGSRY